MDLELIISKLENQISLLKDDIQEREQHKKDLEQ